MISYKSFIDVLFILLLCTMVMLTQSVRIGAIDTAVAKIGADGISPVSAGRVQLVVIGQDELFLDGRAWTGVDEMADGLRPQDPVLLVTKDEDVSHHRVLAVWSELQQRDFDVKLGAQPAPKEDVS